jgi:hypothetical protein
MASFDWWGNSMHHTRAFNPEATQSLCVAFDKVCSTIAERDRSEFVKELIARRVIALAERGEHDPDKLAEAASASLGLHSRVIC